MRTAALALAAIAVTLAALEIGLRVLAPPELQYPFPALFRANANPEIGYELAPDLDRTAYGAVVRTNALGFRSAEVAVEKPAGVFRIVAAGDSITFGYGVANDEAFPQQLERGLAERCPGRRFEVINAGVMGYTAIQGLASLREKLLPLDPDLALFTFVSNDAEPPLAVDERGFLHWESAASARTLARHTQIHRRLPVPGGDWLREHSTLFNLLEIRLNRLWVRLGRGPAAPPAPETPAPEAGRYNADLGERALLDSFHPTYSHEARPVWARIDRALARTVAALAEREVPFWVAAFDMPGLFLERMLELRERHGYPFVGFAYEFGSPARYARDYSLGWDLHPNAAAHARMAEMLYARLHAAGALGAGCAPGEEIPDFREAYAADRARFAAQLADARARVREPAVDLARPPELQLVRGGSQLEEFRRIVLLLRSPENADRLAVRLGPDRGARAEPGALALAPTLNGVALAPREIPSGGAELRWRLPDAVADAELVEVTLRLRRRAGSASGARLDDPARVRVSRVALERAR